MLQVPIAPGPFAGQPADIPGGEFTVEEITSASRKTSLAPGRFQSLPAGQARSSRNSGPRLRAFQPPVRLPADLNDTPHERSVLVLQN
jgi:hypothetical protein